MLKQFAYELDLLILSAQKNIKFFLYGIGIIFLINIINWIIGKPLYIFGIRPRTLRGLLGIGFSFILHQNFNHLFFNLIPGVVLSFFVLKNGLHDFLKINIFIILGSGSLVWLFGRRAVHIGMSGVVSGLYGYVLTNAYLNPGPTSIFLAIIALYYFAGILAGLFPTEDRTSWESHLFGFIIGIVYIKAIDLSPYLYNL